MTLYRNWTIHRWWHMDRYGWMWAIRWYGGRHNHRCLCWSSGNKRSNLRVELRSVEVPWRIVVGWYGARHWLILPIVILPRRRNHHGCWDLAIVHARWRISRPRVLVIVIVWWWLTILVCRGWLRISTCDWRWHLSMHLSRWRRILKRLHTRVEVG
jgi:hypothetical protein